MRHPILLSVALLFAGIAVSAQNLNPVVEVTNTYEQAATGIEKPDQTIAVPDSLLRFNLDMDYEMRTTPYKGAYEFNPYLVELKPMPRYTGEGTLFVRLGAGYGLHPEADVVWSPVKADNFRLNLYANHRSYFGQYRAVHYPSMNFTSADEPEKLLFRGDKEDLYNGAESNTSAGINTLLAWQSGSWNTDLHYQHLYASDPRSDFNHHVAALQTRVKSAPQNRFYYNLGVRGNYLVRDDGMKGGIVNAHRGIASNRKNSQARLDLFGEGIFTQAGTAGQFGFIPRFVFKMGSLHFNLGLKVAFVFRSQEDFYPGKGGYVFPDVHIDYRVVPEDFILYASATGENKMQGYAPLLQQNHFLPSFTYDGFDVEVEHVNVAAGARGNIGRRFRYDTKIGYAVYSNAVLWGFYSNPNLYGGGWHPAVYRHNYGLFYADFAGGWTSEHVDVDAHLRYQSSSLKAGYMVFAPAAFVAQAKVLYNWAERIKLGVDLDASTDRLSQWEGEEDGPVFGLPGYADLGLYAEYGFTRKFAVWVRGGNLLNMEVQRTPFHAERGIYFTAGLQYRF